MVRSKINKKILNYTLWIKLFEVSISLASNLLFALNILLMNIYDD